MQLEISTQCRKKADLMIIKHNDMVTINSPNSFAEDILSEVAVMQDHVGVGCHATVLAVQIHGAEPEDLPVFSGNLTQEYSQVMTKISEIIKSYNGSMVSTFSGGYLAVFGIPKALKDKEDRAIQCALDIRKSITKHYVKIGSKMQQLFKVSIALSAGYTCFGYVDFDLISKLCITGDPVNSVAKMISLAKRGQIVASDSLRQKLENVTPFTVRNITAYMESLDPIEILEVKDSA